MIRCFLFVLAIVAVATTHAKELVHTKPVLPGNYGGISTTPKHRYPAEYIWDKVWIQQWDGSELEGQVPYCQKGSYRQEPITNFDINKDGFSEILLPISCYQGEPVDYDVKHNRAVRAAWLMFCSDTFGNYHNCTRELFDDNKIEATVTEHMGGIPYTHVADTGYDINKDGYPDIWMAINRDDGRPGLDPNDPEDQRLYDEYCGVPEEHYHEAYKCTWKSVQSVLLSSVRQGVLKYNVVPLPWDADLIFDMVVLPNAQGTVDIFAPVDPIVAARLTKENTFVDVSEEYENYKNIQAVAFSSPYSHTFRYENTQYYVTSGVQESVYTHHDPHGFNGNFKGDGVTERMGFTLWKWVPGVGFELSDFYTPPREDLFTYRYGEPNDYETRTGAYLRGKAVFEPYWHFFDTAKLQPNEPLTLVIAHESSMTMGVHFDAPVKDHLYYESLDTGKSNYENILGPVTMVQGFHIIDGKIHERSQSVVEGDVLWDTPSIRVSDMNNDGFDDLYGTTGHIPTGSIYINNGFGTLERIDFSESWPYDPLDKAWLGGYGGVVRDLGMGPYLHFIQFGNGMIDPPWEWPEYANGYPHPDLIIRDGMIPIDEMPRRSPEQLHQALHQCHRDYENQWFYTCRVF
jgi:hypothetical protein